MTNVAKMYFLIGFLYSLCFCHNIAKDKFKIDKFLTVKKLYPFTKRTSIGLRLIGHLDLWVTKNFDIKEKARKSRNSQIWKYQFYGRLKKSKIKKFNTKMNRLRILKVTFSFKERSEGGEK